MPPVSLPTVSLQPEVLIIEPHKRHIHPNANNKIAEKGAIGIKRMKMSKRVFWMSRR